MGISISGPSTQIPVEVVEIGNEITQNQLNAITAAVSPSSSNSFQTVNSVASYVSSAIVNKLNSPVNQWGWNFPIPANIPIAWLDGSWVPLAASGTTLGYDTGASVPITANFDFSFTDDQSNYISLYGSSQVGNDNVTVYTASGNYDGSVTDSTTTVYFEPTGPSYAGNWDSYENYASYTDSSYNTMYRYVYRDESGGFYTADNSSNPPS